MTTALTRRPETIPDDQCVVLSDIDWKGYSTMLRLRGERGVPKMVYLDGDLFLMAPSSPHEHLKSRLGQFVREVVIGLDVDCRPTSQTTFRRRSKRGGVEGDETFYIANEACVRGKAAIDLRIDPPPDLAIEVVHSHGAEKALEVYRRLRVPEVWVCDGGGLTIFVLGADGRYAKSPNSAAFPFLTASEVFDWIGRPESVSETSWMKDLRTWASETLPARRGGQP
jgi:Uma2 family endonuclease